MWLPEQRCSCRPNSLCCGLTTDVPGRIPMPDKLPQTPLLLCRLSRGRDGRPIQIFRPGKLTMLIGAGPGSTGGGIKTMVFVVTVLNVRTVFCSRPHVQVWGRRLPARQVSRGRATIGVAVLLVMTASANHAQYNAPEAQASVG